MILLRRCRQVGFLKVWVPTLRRAETRCQETQNSSLSSWTFSLLSKEAQKSRQSEPDPVITTLRRSRKDYMTFQKAYGASWSAESWGTRSRGRGVLLYRKSSVTGHPTGNSPLQYKSTVCEVTAKTRVNIVLFSWLVYPPGTSEVSSSPGLCRGWIPDGSASDAEERLRRENNKIS